MAILDYSQSLSRGGLGIGGRAIGIAGELQNQQAQRQQMGLRQMQMDAMQREQEALQADEIRQQELTNQAQQIYSSGDVNALAEFSIANPEYAQRILQAKGLVNEADKARVSDRFARIYASPNPIELLTQEVEQGQANGLDMSDSIAMLQQAPTNDQLRQQAAVALASIDPKRQQAIASAMPQQQSSSSRQRPASVQELEEYRSMEDGPLKEAYGRKIGLITKEGFELTPTTMKLIEESDNTYRQALSNAGNFENLANQFDNLDARGGVLGSLNEKFKSITGDEDAITGLKKQYASIVNAQVMAGLPPGAASDKDIDFAKEGFLLSNANPKQIASFMRGLAKIEAGKALYSEWRSNYISETGSPRDLTREWKKYRSTDEYKQAYADAIKGINQKAAQPAQAQEASGGFDSLSDEDLLGG